MEQAIRASGSGNGQKKGKRRDGWNDLSLLRPCYHTISEKKDEKY